MTRMLVLLCAAGMLLSGGEAPFSGEHGTFSNPIIAAPSADPWVIRHEGAYYLCESRGRAIALRTSRRLTDMGMDSGRVVWQAPAAGPCSREIWAPELHHVGERWYIYFAADGGRNEDHRMWVIASRGNDLWGPYGPPRMLETGGWAIDGTLLQRPDGTLLFIWSGWPSTTDGLQNLYIARMSGPETVTGPRTLLTSPAEPWERRGMPICEGPEVLTHEGRLFIVYSASGSWTASYCLGLLRYTGGSVQDPRSWKKSGPLFSGSGTVYGPGHCSFLPSPDSTEDWIVYHAKERPENGWEDRSVRAQRIAWNSDGSPRCGIPAMPGERLPVPSEGPPTSPEHP